jgi:hypothetical protein
MTKTLFNLKDYCIFTFISTSHALKAERVLKEAAADFLIMPTPREISTSCGLAVKVAPGDQKPCYEILINKQVQVEGIYQVTEINGKTRSERIDNG